VDRLSDAITPASDPAVACHAGITPNTMPTASAAAVAPAPSPEPSLADLVLHFDFAKSTLTDDAKTALNEAFSRVKSSETVSLALEGHADAIGSESYNKRLGLERAETVRRHLAEQYHIPAGQIGVISYGEERPAASNSTKEGRDENRRVMIKVGR
jgi:OOP family OmpA-OmpF porin